MCRVLLDHPGEFHGRFTQVELWDESEERDGPDAGIDLIATDVDGDRWAIQTKCYRDARAPEKGVDSFLAKANTARFQHRMFISTSRASPPVTRPGLRKLRQAGCRVLYHGDLAQWPVPWTELAADPDRAPIPRVLYEPHPYQQDAIDDVVASYDAGAARGQLILPCGTGKSVVALWIAERVVPEGGTVLYVVPSISLLGQTMREWASQRRSGQRYVGVCSDRTAGKRGGNESANLTELSIPVTTDPDRISEVLTSPTRDRATTVVFSTYQSLDQVAAAQDLSGVSFDLVLCDEAHRTTGVETPKRGISPFTLVHHSDRIRAERRLYMTATPRLYTEQAKQKARSKDIAVFSMNDPDVFGDVFYEMSFKAAVDGGWLSDYQVAIVAVDRGLYGDLADNVVNTIQLDHGDEIRADDVVAMLGCWDAMADPLSRGPGRGRRTGQTNPNPSRAVKRAIAFQNTIKASRQLARLWQPVIDGYVEQQPAPGADNGLLRLDVTHVDGTTRASERATAIADLKADIGDGQCRVVSNARCLSEGVDVPALDAVLFLAPKRSVVEIIQAVGRVMRTAAEKERGYIILPVILPAGKTRLDDAVLRSPKFKPVWDVIRALRAHDERMDVWVNTADKGGKPPINVIGGTEPDDTHDDRELDNATVAQMTLPLDSEIASALVEICGDRTYWATWGDDVGEVTATVAARISRLISSRPDTGEAFGRFLAEMRQTINEHLQEADLVDMLACHIVTLPVFNALFGSAAFASLNPVVAALNQMTDTLDRDHIRADTARLDRLYDSVTERVRQVTDPEGRLKILLELYESFFAKGMKRETDRLGVAYTPIELVDYVLRSADRLSQHHFGKSLSDPGVHVLDPFTGTGTFINRLLTINDSNGRPLIADEDLDRKYTAEIHANEILLLAYYIAAVKSEEGWRQRRPDSDYQPFSGIVLCDTFATRPDQQQFDTLSGNSRRAEQQAGERIDVIVGNPPWSAGQKTAAEDNPNIGYPKLRQRIRDTYAARADTTNKRQMYDAYKMALRWATDRIGDQGIVAFVTPNSVLDGNAESGIRACLADEYHSLYLLNLRGDARLSGDARRKEKGNIFGGSTRVGILVSVLVKHPHQPHPDRQARIWYHNIGDYLTTDQKKQALQDMWHAPPDGEGWRSIKPDSNHDWINQSDPTWQHLIPLGDKTTKQAALRGTPNKDAGVVFYIYSLGFATGQDPYLYDYDVDVLSDRAEAMVYEYEHQRDRIADGRATVEQATANVRPQIIKWHSGLKSEINRDRDAVYDKRNLREVHYRPFVKMWLYYDPLFIARVYRVPLMFPHRPDSANQAMVVAGRGSTRDFSTMATDTAPDLELVSKGQVMPRYEQTPHTSPESLSLSLSRRIKRSTSPDRERPSGSQHSSRTAHRTCTCCQADKRSPDTPTRADESRDQHDRTRLERSLLDADKRNPSRHSAHGQRSGVPPVHISERDEPMIADTAQMLDLGDLDPTSDRPDEQGRVDNITDWCLNQFRSRYQDPAITKDHIWAYIYGVMHAPDWRTRYANDLRKGLPRIPYADDFWAFAEAGRELIDLHVGYETCEPYPDVRVLVDGRAADPHSDDPDVFRIRGRMRWARTRGEDGKLANDLSVLLVNDRCRIEDIPPEAHQYVVNGKTSLGWAIDRLKATRDTKSGISRDPNQWHAWTDQPYNLIQHLCRLITVSVNTVRIVNGLPPSLPPDDPNGADHEGR